MSSIHDDPPDTHCTPAAEPIDTDAPREMTAEDIARANRYATICKLILVA
jgi:hypothetical protein